MAPAVWDIPGARWRLVPSGSRLAATLFLLLSTTALSSAQQLPTGGTVAAGSATIGTPQNGTLTINQTSQRAILDWTSFSIGQGGTVNFNQPNAAAATLNRVSGSTPSTIAGTINAPGTVLLVNPNGIAITSSGVINVGSFAASTLSIKDQDFMAGNYRFSGNGASAAVTNAGRINVSDGGFAALLGGSVANSGVISARLGKVGLASGELVTLDLAGDGFLSVAVPSNQLGNIVDAQGKPLVSNTGKIKADGGAVYLSAATAATLLRDAVNVPGSIRANSVGTRNGRIVINGGGGSVKIGGRLAANGGKDGNGGSVSVAGTDVAVSGKVSAKGKAGGRIDVTGNNVTLAGASIDASGATAGGLVRIGGEFQGGQGSATDPLYQSFVGRWGVLDPLAYANTVSVDAGTRIDVSARNSGDGGAAVVWSNDVTSFAGAIAARGANGGVAEVSGHRLLDFTGTVDLAARGGLAGTLLLDPENVTISSSADAGGAIAGGTYTPSADSSILNVTTLQNALASANVNVTTGSTGSQAGNITVADALTWSSNKTLTLTAANAIAVNAAVTATNGGLTLSASNTAADSVTASAAISVGAFTLSAGNWTQNTASLPSFAAGNFTINGGSFLRAVGGTGASGTPYQIADIYGLQGAGSASTQRSLRASNYVLANDIDAGGTSGWNSGAGFAPIGTQGGTFAGSFNGQGHVVSNLTINRPSTDYVGLFGYFAGTTISNIGVVGGTITGHANVGALIGRKNNGTTVSNSYSTAAVQSTATDHVYNVGGLIGDNFGTLQSSYATGTVTTASSDIDAVGGLVGGNDGGTITDSYATGKVTGARTNGISGLVGWSSGTITNSYATGMVSAGSGSTNIGGVLGSLAGGSLSNTYFDTQTTGIGSANGVGSSASYAGATGTTTAQLQSALPTGFSSSTWGVVAGVSYPYLKSFYASAPQVVSGIAYSDLGVTAAAGVAVSALGNGSALSNPLVGTVRTGANGYYYFLLPSGSIGANTQLAAYTTGGTGGVSFQHNASGSTSGLDIWGTALREASAATALSSVASGLTTAIGASGVSTSFNNLAIVSTGSSFAIDQAVSKSGVLSLNAAGSVTQSAAVTAGSLQLLGAGSYTLTNASNSVGTLAANTGAISFTDNAALTVGTVGGTTGITSTGNVTLNGTSTINLGANVTATSGRLTLNASNGSAITASGAVNVAAFTLQAGAWSQNTASLPSFAANDFTITSGASFLRVTGGDGSSGTPYQIADLYGLQGIGSSATLLAKSYTLVSDIDASGTSTWNSNAGFNPIGNATTAFTGSFNGQSHTITGLTINRPSSDYVGLFGRTTGGSIQKIGLVGGSTTGRDNVGALVGSNFAAISQSYATGSVNGRSLVGGLTGQTTHQILSSYATGAVTASSTMAGGLTGYSNYDITSSYATGAVSGSDMVGGLVGKIGGSVTRSYATGTVTSGGSLKGGFAGQTDGISVNNSFWDTQTSGQSVGIGNASPSGLTGKTTAQMKSLATYTGAGWSIDDTGGTSSVWRIYDGNTYPLLRAFLTPLTATYAAASKTYDGSTYGGSFGTPTLSVPGASLSGSATVVGSAATAVNAGSYAITGSYFSNQAGYDIAYAGALTINKATLAALSGSKTYNASTTVAATAFGTNGTISTGIGGQTLVLSGSGSVASANAGSAQALTLGSLALTNGTGLASNYQFGSGNTATIGKATLAALSASKTYDASTAVAASAFGTAGTIATGINGETLVLSGSGSVASANAGAAQSLTLGSLSVGDGTGLASNYQFGSGNTATIGKATLAALSGSKTYDGDATFTATLFGSTGTIATGVNGETLVLGGSAAAASANAGSGLALNVGGLTLGNGTGLVSNYQLGSGNTGTINQRALTISGVSAANKVYDATTAATLGGTAALANTVSGDDVSLSGTASGAFADKNVGVGKAVAVSGYTLAGTAAANYTLTQPSGVTADITSATLTYTADAKSRVYGNANPALTGSVTGFAGTDTLASATTGTVGFATAATAASGVGSYAINGSGLTANNGNYVFVQAAGNATALTVAARPIEVTADPQSKPAGQPDPTLTYALTAGTLIGGDTLSGALARLAGESVGVYPINQGTLAASANYALSFIGANLTIGNAPAAATTGAGTAPSQVNNTNTGSTPAGGNTPTQTTSVGSITVNTAVGGGNVTGGGTPVTGGAAGVGGNIVTGSIGGANGTSGQGGTVFQPISYLSQGEYSNGDQPPAEAQATQAAVLVMIGRAAGSADLKIDTLLNGGTAQWSNAPATISGRVVFGDGNGSTRTPSGDNGFAFANGATDVVGMLKQGPVMLGGAKTDGATGTAPWMLATGLAADGKGIVANDPITGQKVVLAYDPQTKVVGAPIALLDSQSQSVNLDGNAQLPGPGGTISSQALNDMKTFVPASYFAVTIIQ